MCVRVVWACVWGGVPYQECYYHILLISTIILCRVCGRVHYLQYGEDELLIEVELGLCALHKRPVSKIRQVFGFPL